MGTSSGYSSAARRQAAHILSQPPFTNGGSRVPAPFRGVLHTIGQGLRDVFGPPISWLWRHLLLPAFRGVHGTLGGWTWVLLGVVAVAVGVAVGVVLARRRTRIAAAKPPELALADVEDVAELEAAAAAADARGDYGDAVRLRFRAGLARLEAAGVIASRLVVTTQQAHRALRSQTFDGLAASHEAIAYGGIPATPDDSASAREKWPRVLAEVAPSRTREEP